ncbi:hypothetical protein EJ05DRAFT_499241 [Pseudovirgaria hyperparasitica]|uniref:Uncharacterized protein n=1 Tax=Pseudovirgaria hyperparasitica TaxID=470096 RepID=A0A6A6WDX9_9PEZI|nr:uncharacterized protein EJ05DRAFT_499241 [Pseudovirgaria hyperparasitica]KAF2760056.1 hypothetical protein EJ05DRAFT_499241 [Pseudovirgaria hyperparasitica]
MYGVHYAKDEQGDEVEAYCASEGKKPEYEPVLTIEYDVYQRVRSGNGYENNLVQGHQVLTTEPTMGANSHTERYSARSSDLVMSLITPAPWISTNFHECGISALSSAVILAPPKDWIDRRKDIDQNADVGMRESPILSITRMVRQTMKMGLLQYRSDSGPYTIGTSQDQTYGDTQDELINGSVEILYQLRNRRVVDVAWEWAYADGQLYF